MSEGYPKFQINLDYDTGMFTVRAESHEEFVNNLVLVAGQETADRLLEKIETGFANLLTTPPRQRRDEDDAQGKLRDGGIETTKLVDKLCPGHKVAMTKKSGRRGDFWSCNGKLENGDFAWKTGEGCKAEDYVNGDEKYNPAPRINTSR